MRLVHSSECLMCACVQFRIGNICHQMQEDRSWRGSAKGLRTVVRNPALSNIESPCFPTQPLIHGVQMFPVAVLLATSMLVVSIKTRNSSKRRRGAAVYPSAILLPSPPSTRMCVAWFPVCHSSPPCTYVNAMNPKTAVSSTSHLIAGEGSLRGTSLLSVIDLHRIIIDKNNGGLHREMGGSTK